MIKTIRSVGLVLALFLAPFCLSVANANFSYETHTLSKYHFTTPPGLADQVNFWKKIYSEYTTRHAVVHDMRNLGVVYEVVYLGEKPLSRRSRERKLEKVKKKYKRILRRINKTKNKSSLKGEDLRIYKLVKKDFYQATRQIRAQLGLKDRFKEGVERSGLYMTEILRILKKYNLPEELSVLPHVESSFQLGAYSSAGAAGIWQFTRSTGRLFMRVGYDVDERRDPILATYAAAKLLKKNFEGINSWPLAITAYNHGLQGMKRAQKRHGSDISKIVRNYKSRTFGFASRNFYAEFLAALHVVKNQNKYFPNLNIQKAHRRVSIRLPNYIHVNTAMDYFGMTREEIAESNPSLRRPVLNGEKRIPKGFVFQAPSSKLNNLQTKYDKIPRRVLYSKQLRSKWYTVRRGDTLSGVALRFGSTVRSIKAYNNIGRRNRIYIGQVLQLPKGRSRPTVRLASYTPQNYSLVSYRVRRNDNLSKIAKRFRTDAYHLAKINKIKNPDTLHPGQRIKVPQSRPSIQLAKLGGDRNSLKDGYYRVQKNDNLSKIAKRFDTNVIHLTSLNRMRDPNSLYSGQRLKISGSPAEVTTHKIKNFKLSVDRQGQTVTKQQNKKEIKVARAVPEGTLKVATRTNKRLNKNRPAFMPVSFSSENQESIGTITVDFDETLSHYAEWSLMSVRELRKINRIGKNAEITVHRKLRVSFAKTNPEKFEERRQEYHKAIQEDFFNNYDISKLTIRSVEKGETLWEICNDNYTIPLWLLSSYNSEKNINALAVGEPIIIPVISPKTG
ncbi:LysM peptidoglycan-binding domain-containing protein [bacterium AH-315-C08]|nr:LysM peptidoglycan-binding domain-containing protein [bacterium AH-315-C08]